MYHKIAWMLSLGGLLLAIGCSPENPVSLDDAGDTIFTDESAEDGVHLTTPPRVQGKTWSELKREFADRPPKPQGG